ncbi:MAG: hypothetical protein FJ297_03885 [Planctomycetes bacterium]|nr:hypothetical protein [Planctomycetota bacterium]
MARIHRRPSVIAGRPVPLPVLLGTLLGTLLGAAFGAAPSIGAIEPDLSAYSADCGVGVAWRSPDLTVSWPTGDGPARLVLRIADGEPLVSEFTIAGAKSPVVRADPAVFVTVGSRVVPRGNRPDRPWHVFFDKPATRPHRTFLARLTPRSVRAASAGHRVTIAIGDIALGDDEHGVFSGRWEFTVYSGSPFIRVDAVIRTDRQARAIAYDAAMLTDAAPDARIGWMDTEDQWHEEPAGTSDRARPRKNRFRTLVAGTDDGSAACFPPPHQFFFPQDDSDNLDYVWFGKGHHGLTERFGWGIRTDTGAGGHRPGAPWFNAPPGVDHRLGMFLLVHAGGPRETLDRALRYTHGDRFPDLDGYRTLSSHYHMAITVAAMRERESGGARRVPEWVDVFKRMNVNLLHLGEFHGDGHPKDAGAVRLEEMRAMFDECRRLSDERLLVIPGEEINEYFGLAEPGKHPGHWMSLFPKPVYWFARRGPDDPFATLDPELGPVYRVRGREDMLRLINETGALVWTAHPRIKASSWAPDIFRNEDFYLSDRWFGGAWKAMPADLSDDRLGRRVLDLLDDMANWGGRKYVLGEVDTFKLDHTHEIYGHMNVNYVRLRDIPRFDDGWQSVLDALASGDFFVTTGEVLVRDFTAGGVSSGRTLAASSERALVDIAAHIDHTFPLAFAEIISGDGDRVHRERIDLSDTTEFGVYELRRRVDLTGRAWARLEVWDIATNGAFTQPVWIARSAPSQGRP